MRFFVTICQTGIITERFVLLTEKQLAPDVRALLLGRATVGS